MNKKELKFSVGLGLFDYINPILYGITTFIILKNNIFNNPIMILFLLGAIISLIFGLSIPTVKLLVGLQKLKFKMPVNLVFFVNSGIFISGLSLIIKILSINIYTIIMIILLIIFLLYLVYFKTKNFNTIAVLLGAAGYVLIYTSLIILAIKNYIYVSLIIYLLAILLFIFLCMIGIKANLKDPKVHWIIEISNVICQFLVMIGTLILYR